MVYQLLFLILTYFIASIPFGLLLTKKFSGKDIRQFGSKNIGATNVTRVAGKKLGFATLILDSCKGAIMVIVARFSFCHCPQLHLFLCLVVLVAVLGHIYPIYLKFKGGKGVATTLACIFALDLPVGVLMGAFWLLAFCLFRISSVASLISLFVCGLASMYLEAPPSEIILCWTLFALILVKHKGNIARLLLGEEKQI